MKHTGLQLFRFLNMCISEKKFLVEFQQHFKKNASQEDIIMCTRNLKEKFFFKNNLDEMYIL